MVRIFLFISLLGILLSCEKSGLEVSEKSPDTQKEPVIPPPKGLKIYGVGGSVHILNQKSGKHLWSHVGVGNWKLFELKEDIEPFKYVKHEGVYKESDCGTGLVEKRTYDLGNLLTCLSIQGALSAVQVSQGNPTVVVVTEPIKIFSSFNFSGAIQFINYSQLKIYCPFCTNISVENRHPVDPTALKASAVLYVTICPLFKLQETVIVKTLTPQWLGLHPMCPYKNAKFSPAHDLKANISFMPQVEINMMQMEHSYGKEILRWQQSGLVPSSLLLQQQ